jgi:tetratricopeptide (TPR) repeat protein
MRFKRNAAIWTLSAFLFSGCTSLTSGWRSSASAEKKNEETSHRKLNLLDAALKNDAKVVNPPAKMIRFDGREVILGTTAQPQPTTAHFSADLSTLLSKEKFATASDLVIKNTGVAEQVLWEKYSDETNHGMVLFIAGILSKNISDAFSWQSMLVRFNSNPVDADLYHALRKDFTDKLKTEEPSNHEADQLRIIAQRLNHPLLMADALRLLAVRELVAGRNAWAESLFMQAAEMSEQHGDLERMAELWLMIATTANRSQRRSDAEEAWLKAIDAQIASLQGSSRPLNVNFWVRADEQRTEKMDWPSSTAAALVRYCVPVGCQFTDRSKIDAILWCAIAAGQYQAGQPQLALVNFKKAETFANDDNVMWLRIAQGNCLTALGQSQAAVALLSVPANSSNPTIALASTTAMGSAKLQAGDYQQAIQFFSKALNDPRSSDWPARNQAEADLALAHIIVGNTETGLAALRAVQEKFRQKNDNASRLQALENELKTLELEQRDEAAKMVQLKIREIERT